MVRTNANHTRYHVIMVMVLNTKQCYDADTCLCYSADHMALLWCNMTMLFTSINLHQDSTWLWQLQTTLLQPRVILARQHQLIWPEDKVTSIKFFSFSFVLLKHEDELTFSSAPELKFLSQILSSVQWLIQIIIEWGWGSKLCSNMVFSIFSIRGVHALCNPLCMSHCQWI